MNPLEQLRLKFAEDILHQIDRKLIDIGDDEAFASVVCVTLMFVTQKDLACAIGYSETTVSRWRSGNNIKRKHFVREGIVQDIASFLRSSYKKRNDP